MGARLRLRPSVFVTGELTPRVAGYGPGAHTWGTRSRKRPAATRCRSLTNSFGTTFGQLARLGSEHDVYLGFNVTRLSNRRHRRRRAFLEGESHMRRVGFC